MFQPSSNERYMKTLPVLQAGVFCQRTTDTVHPLIIDQVVCDGEINFFQGFNLTVAKKEIFEQIKNPRYVGVTWIYNYFYC